MDVFETLQSLCALTGPSGFESPVARRVEALLEPLTDQVWTGRLGEVVGLRRCGRPNAKKLLLDAHLDEVGLMVTGVEEGFLRFTAIGGVDTRVLPDRELTILTRPEPIFGVVACLPPHVQTPADHDKAVAIEDLRIDVGMSQAQAEKRVPVGTPISYRGGCFRLGADRVCGKSLDDRSCMTVLLRTVELLRDVKLDVDLYLMGSTREEISGAGAVVGTNAVRPDFCVAVDVTHAATPDGAGDTIGTLGGGPAVGMGPNMTWWMTNRLIAKAGEAHVPYQREVMAGNTGTNGWEMQTCLEGIPTAIVSLPLRYMHTPNEVVALSDMEETARLLAAFVAGLGEEAGQC